MLNSTIPHLNRRETIEKILELNENALFITSAGYISRELYNLSDSPRNFYMQGSMGCALGFAMGLAMNIDEEVVVIIGDGELLMSLGSLALSDKLKLKNLSIYILDNNIYESTGGQKTCSDSLRNCRMGHNVWTCYINDVGEIPPRIDMSCKEIAWRFYEAVNYSS